jgi:hypothetical protein
MGLMVWQADRVARRASCFFLLAALLWCLPALAIRPDSLENRVGGCGHPASGQTSATASQALENAMGCGGCGYGIASGQANWLNRDPIGELGGINLYGFVGNNPINFCDPLGLALGDWWDVGATQGYLNNSSANGLSGGGVLGYLQFIGSQLAEDLIDISGASSVAGSAQQSGAASANPCDQGAALGYGLLTAGTILFSAIPGEGAGAGEFGDLTVEEIEAIQNVVNQAGRPLEVVGSAASGTRTALSDIDYVIPPSSLQYFEGLETQLPGLDPTHGIIPGVGNPNIGPVIRFEPNTFP